MTYLAGVDIGNSSTEVALMRQRNGHQPEFCASALYRTTGLKGTKKNVPGVVSALARAASDAGIDVGDIDRVLLNEAAPVIGDVAMETITETVTALFDDPERVDRMATAAREYVETTHSWERRTQDIMRIYEEVRSE
jgi:molecular chaperone DnaK (HSP70)